MNAKIGENIKKIRKLRNMTQAELAAKISVESGEEVTPLSISRWERGERTIPAEIIAYCSKALDVSAQAFYDQKTSVDDKRLLLEYAALPERSKEILRHIVSGWNGDVKALIYWIAMYSSIERKHRADIVGPSIHHYHELHRAGKTDSSAPPPDMEYLEKTCDAMMTAKKRPRQK